MARPDCPMLFNSTITMPEGRRDAADLLSDALDIHRVLYAAMAGDKSLLDGETILAVASLVIRSQELVEAVWSVLNEAHGDHSTAKAAAQLWNRGKAVQS